MELYYTPDIQDDKIKLEGEEARHLLKVMRHRRGEQVFVTDGKGFLYTTEITDENPGNCVLNILKKERKEDRQGPQLHIGIAPVKSADRFEWFLEKSVEIGIDEITPIICSRSERRIIKPERMQKVLVSAMKQSLKCSLPLLHSQQNISGLIQSNGVSQRYICVMDAKESLQNRYDPTLDTIILIGPEGDFTEDEIEEAGKHGFVPVSLGNSRMRTETAGIMACATIALMNQRKIKSS